MALKHGSTTISTPKHGSTTLTKVYHGSTLVFGSLTHTKHTVTVTVKTGRFGMIDPEGNAAYSGSGNYLVEDADTVSITPRTAISATVDSVSSTAIYYTLYGLSANTNVNATLTYYTYD